MGRKAYPSDLSDQEWSILKGYIPQPKPGGRPARHERREIVNAIRYVLRNGCAWRALPHDFPPYTTVYDYYRAWRESGLWEQINTALRHRLRLRLKRHPHASAASIDSQSVKTT